MQTSSNFIPITGQDFMGLKKGGVHPGILATMDSGEGFKLIHLGLLNQIARAEGVTLQHPALAPVNPGHSRSLK